MIDVNEYELNNDREYIVNIIIIVKVIHHEYLHNIIIYMEITGNINFSIYLLIDYLLCLTHKSVILQLRFLVQDLLRMLQMLEELF